MFEERTKGLLSNEVVAFLVDSGTRNMVFEGIIGPNDNLFALVLSFLSMAKGTFLTASLLFSILFAINPIFSFTLLDD